jgi:hypothetical protein
VSGAFAIQVGQTVTLTATTKNYDTTETYTWASSDALIATVDTAGKVTGVTPGNVTITVTGATTQKVATYNMVVEVVVTQYDEWLGSAHADYNSEPFRHWDHETGTGADNKIDPVCSRCHSSTGYQNYLNGGLAALVPVTPGEVITCETCHNSTAAALTSVTFENTGVATATPPIAPVTLTGLGGEARCMVCHQGLESTNTVNAKIGTIADDTTDATLGFANVHYYAAGGTLNAGKVKVGYQYAGKVYDYRFRHVPGFDTCIGCHNQHSLKLRIDRCAECHTLTGTTYEDRVASLRNVRMQSSLAIDYDGDGNTTEGISKEIDHLRADLLVDMRKYTADKSLTQICYNAAVYPYWFKDNAPSTDGTCVTADATFANKYGPWNPRLLRAAYNYQVSVKDPGAFAHNAKYIIELLFDSLENVNAGIANAANKRDMSAMNRTDFGHFNGAGEPARHWDTGEAVDSGCSKCHSGSAGYKYWLKYAVPLGGAEQDNGLDCMTCHTTFEPFPVKATPNLEQPPSVLFPSNKTVAADTTTGSTKIDKTSMVCMTCHSGRESKATVDLDDASQAAAGKAPRFRNVHYLAAGAVLLGKEAQVGYEYTGKTYGARTVHPGGLNCNFCHNGDVSKHTFDVAVVYADAAGGCAGCHAGSPPLASLGRSATFTADYDGNGNVDGTTAGGTLADELKGLQAKLLTTMQTKAPICYNGAAYPYWFKYDTGTNTCTTTQFGATGSGTTWTTALTHAAFNYQFAEKDPGAWAHNFKYVGELLFDAIDDVGGAGTAAGLGLTRP